jgi:CBS-domain-containing membrane protein
MSEAYASNKIVPISDPIPDHNTVTSRNKCTTIILEGIGWAGSILVLCPYVVTFEKTIDFVLNTLGATGLLIVCIKSKQYQSIIINTAWIIGGIYKYYANS